MSEENTPKLVVRNATPKDLAAIKALADKVYSPMPGYTREQLFGQLTNFPAGQFVALYGERLVGYSATFRISGEIALQRHTWREITGHGFASRHDPEGDYLYGMEVCVDPEFRGQRIGQRLYNERRKLCMALGLKGVVFGGRLPGLARRISKLGSAEAYVEQVKTGKQRDRVLTFQMRNDFEVIGVLPGYLPSDSESLGYAAHLVWRNPRFLGTPGSQARQQRGRLPDSVRVATVQFQQRAVRSFEDFAHNVEYFVDVVADYKADFAVFPELFTLQLLSIENQKIPAAKAIAELDRHTQPLKELLSRLAVSYNINIIGGSHPTRAEDGRILNVCYVCLRDGSIHTQAKIHPTPNERYWWNIEGDARVQAILTDCGPIGVMICYDSEFPEIARHLIDQGALILFVPFLTDERQAYMRVRYCAQARAVENQCYVALSGSVGNLPRVENADIHYAQSCILTPCDLPFARDGVAADTTPNVEMVAFADLSLARLFQARSSGSVQNLKDRRYDLYSVQWRGD